MTNSTDAQLSMIYGWAMNTLLRADAKPADLKRAGARKQAVEAERLRRALVTVGGR